MVLFREIVAASVQAVATAVAYEYYVWSFPLWMLWLELTQRLPLNSDVHICAKFCQLPYKQHLHQQVVNKRLLRG